MKKFLFVLSITILIVNVSVLIYLRVNLADFVHKSDLEKLRQEIRENQDNTELYWNDIESRLEGRVKSLENPYYKDGQQLGRIYQAISPDGYYVVRTYFNDPESSVKLLRVGESVEKLLYQSERTTYPPFWVGNDHVAFYTRCGSSCKGTMLIDVKRGRLMTGVVSYIPKDPSLNSEWETVFKDWFGKEHRFKGVLGSMYGQSLNGVDYVVLYETDERGAVIQEQKLRFLGDRLI